MRRARKTRAKVNAAKVRDSSESVEYNPTNCKYFKKCKGNGFAHGPPNNIPHSKCNFNKKWKGWRPRWVCEKIGVEYKEG